MTTTQYSLTDYFQSAIRDLSEAFGHLQKNLSACILLVVPMAAIIGVIFALTIGSAVMSGAFLSSINPDASEVSTGSMVGALGFGFAAVLGILLAAPIGLYGLFCKLRFVVRSHQDADRSFGFGDLWGYEGSFIPFIGLHIAQWLIGIPFFIVAWIVAIITFFLLGLPGFLVIFLFGAFVAVSSFAFFEQPTNGIGGALSRGFEVVTKDWKRWLALSIVAVGVKILLGIVNMVLMVVIGWIPIIGQVGMTFFSFLSLMYFAFAYYRCYRDSLAATAG